MGFHISSKHVPLMGFVSTLRHLRPFDRTVIRWVILDQVSDIEGAIKEWKKGGEPSTVFGRCVDTETVLVKGSVRFFWYSLMSWLSCWSCCKDQILSQDIANIYSPKCLPNSHLCRTYLNVNRILQYIMIYNVFPTIPRLVISPIYPHNTPTSFWVCLKTPNPLVNH